MDLVLVGAIISCLLAVASAVFGVNYKQTKDKITKLLLAVIAAIEDDEVTEEELQKIVAEVREFLKA